MKIHRQVRSIFLVLLLPFGPIMRGEMAQLAGWRTGLNLGWKPGRQGYGGRRASEELQKAAARKEIRHVD